jgi:hypothetical protein
MTKESKKFVFNWGHGIALFFTIFVITTISILLISFTKDFDLQTENYYQEELVFEEMITKKRNVIADQLVFEVSSTEGAIEFTISGHEQQEMHGDILIYRPSDKRLDLKFELTLDENGKQVIRHESLQAGLYLIKVDFASANKEYYLEKEFVFE